MVSVRASSTVEPETATAVTALAVPSAVTSKSDADAVIDERVSLKLRMILVPSVVVALESNEGASVSEESMVEVLVTAMLLREAESLPA